MAAAARRDGDVLDLDGGDGCTALNALNPWDFILERGDFVVSELYSEFSREEMHREGEAQGQGAVAGARLPGSGPGALLATSATLCAGPLVLPQSRSRS